MGLKCNSGGHRGRCCPRAAVAPQKHARGSRTSGCSRAGRAAGRPKAPADIAFAAIGVCRTNVTSRTGRCSATESEASLTTILSKNNLSAEQIYRDLLQLRARLIAENDALRAAISSNATSPGVPRSTQEAAATLHCTCDAGILALLNARPSFIASCPLLRLVMLAASSLPA